MIESKQISREEYIAEFRNWISRAHENGIEPIVVCHEGEKDLQLCHDITENETSCNVYAPNNALEIKGILKKAEFVLASRYHALISSLTYGVPVIAYGWSHKYEAVMQEFSLDKFIISPHIKQKEDPFDLLLDENHRRLIQNKIKIKLPSIHNQLNELWNLILSDISKRIKNKPTIKTP